MHENLELVYLNAYICIFDIDFLQIFSSIKLNCLTVHRKLTQTKWIHILKLYFSMWLRSVKTLSKAMIKSLVLWLHASRCTEVISLTLRNSRANIECLFQNSRLLIYDKLWVMELSQLIRGCRHCPVTSQLCKRFCLGADNSIPFHHISGPSPRLMEKAFQHTEKSSKSFPSLTYPRETITAARQKDSKKTLPTHPSVQRIH